MRRIFLFISCCLLSLVMLAQVPTITLFTPASGTVGTSVTITGTKFSSTPANNIVYFGATRAAVTSGAATQLQVTVPAGATYEPITVNVNGLTAASTWPFIVTFPGGGTITSNSFASKVDFTTATAPANATISDLDGDGKPDLIVAASNNGPTASVSIFRNTSTTGAITVSSLAGKLDLNTGATVIGIATGDLDGDGKPDLAVANAGAGSNSVSVFKNISTSGTINAGSLAAKVDFPAGTTPYHLAIGDVDGDGKLDIVTANTGSGTISIFRNTGTTGAINSGSFAAKVDYTIGSLTAPYHIAIADMDVDGKPEIVVSNAGNSTVSVFLNTSTAGTIDGSSFGAKVDFTTGANSYCVSIGDLDADGKPEMVVANAGSSTVSVFRNTSTPGTINAGSFSSKVDLIPGSNPIYVAIGDLDGDGKPDLAVANNTGGTVSVFKNNSTTGSITSGSFAAKVDFVLGAATNPYCVAIGDIDGDGIPDLVVSNNASNTVSILRVGAVPPTITLINPTSAGSGTTITITGTNFTGATAVGFGGTAATSFNIVSATSITAVVASGTSGDVSVTTPGGTAMLATFTFLPIPTISSFNPTSGLVGASVTISGTNFSTTPSNNIVFFGATKATVTVATTTQLTVTVPTGATYQPITVIVGGLTAYSSKPFVTTFSGGGMIDANSFAAKVDFITGISLTYPYDVAIGDLDGDGKPDLAVANNGANSVLVFRNTSTTGAITASSFAAKVEFATGAAPVSVAFGDLDGDGKPDLAVANYNSGSVSVFKNTSATGAITTSSFAAKVDFTTGAAPLSVAIGDLDGDGKPDLAVTNQGGSVSIFKNTSTTGAITTSSFAAKVDFTTGASSLGVAIGDLDGDGKPDLAVANNGSTSVSVFKNTSTTGAITASSFAAKVDFTTGTNPYIVAIGDLDGDGKPDLAVTNDGSNSVSVFKNTSTTGAITASSFAAKVDFTTGTNPYGVAVGDLDGDGKPDLAVTNAGSTSVSVFKNTSTTGVITASSFAFKVDFATGAAPYRGVAIGDLDGDGKPDLAVANTGSTSVSILRNKIADTVPPTISSFSPQSGTIGTSVAISGTNFDTTPANNTVKFNGTVSIITGTPTATSIVTSVPAGATTGTITVTVGGQTVTSSGIFTVVIDTTPPVVSANNTLNSVALNTAISVSANLTDVESGIASAKVLYKSVAGTLPNNFTSLDMTLTGSSFLATIPAAAVTELGVEYKYLVVNGAGIDNTASQTLYKTVINHSSGLTISSYPGSAAGKLAVNYRIIAFPLVLQSKTANDVFNNVLGGYDPTIWRMFRYNGTTFAELNGSSALVPGEGYFFIAVSSSPLNTGAGTTLDVSTASPFTISLSPGWNQIGNPYNFNISWADVVAANPSETANLGGNSSKIRTFRGSVENVDVLKTFEGGFVKYLGSAAGSIKIPVAKNTSIQGRISSGESVSTNSLDEPSWEIMFNLKAGDVEYNLGGIGMRPDAKEGFDYYDDFNAPRFIDYMEIRFPKKYVGMTYTKDVVPTDENYVWRFSVESNLKEEITSLNWNNSYFGSGKEIYLVDIVTQRITNMSAESRYEFNRTTSKEFKVVYGTSEFVKKEIIPNNVILFDPSPNPFTDRVSIEYSLPKEAETLGGEIEIYNIIGSKVSSGSLPKQSGVGKWIWESEGQALGFYLVRLKVGDGVATKKMLKK